MVGTEWNYLSKLGTLEDLNYGALHAQFLFFDLCSQITSMNTATAGLSENLKFDRYSG